jgi:hypothetical protein
MISVGFQGGLERRATIRDLRAAPMRLRRSTAAALRRSRAVPATILADDVLAVMPPVESGEAEIHRRNDEWIESLRREWPHQR